MVSIMRLLKLIKSARTVFWRRTVATWSPLASAFNSTEPQLKSSSYHASHGLFGITELQSHDGFHVLLVRITYQHVGWFSHREPDQNIQICRVRNNIMQCSAIHWLSQKPAQRPMLPFVM